MLNSIVFQTIPRYFRPSLTRLASPVPRRLIHRPTALLSVLDADFNSAKDRLNTLKEDPGNEAKLELYALFKQATIGKCNTPKPGAFDFVGKAKWTAWNSLGDMAQDQAKEKYVNVVMKLVAAEGGAAETGTAAAEGAAASFTSIKYTVEEGVATILLNRPNKKNAVIREMYEEWGTALQMAADDPNVVVAVITGAGDYYSSGNDLNNFLGLDLSNMSEEAKIGAVLLEKFINAFIDFPKPLIAAVNGPAVGVSVTTLGLMDVVYASDRATFNTPFAVLGQSPEGCSSYTFPRIMGAATANEFLLFGRKFTANYAFQNGLVTEVIPDGQFRTEVEKRVKEFAKLPRNALKIAKNLIRDTERDTLHKVNAKECETLVERWTSDECAEAVMNFFAKASSKAKL